MSDDRPFAHSVSERPEEEWELLDDHAAAVARRAALFASAFDARDWGEAAGWLHDLGKIKPRFQRRLRGEAIAEPHAGEGAKAAIAHYGDACGALLSPGIAGHHAGLPNAREHARGRPATPLNERLRQAANVPVPVAWPLPEALSPPAPLRRQCIDQRYAATFLARMLFSCLTDADSLETERFYAQAGEPDAAQRSSSRAYAYDLDALKGALDTHLDRFEPPRTEVNRLRAEVLSAARAKAADPPGLFSFTVPTGGGKTLASLAFALEHALAHGLRRIVYVIPFTSIVEQTAQVFREALHDDDAILEFHSGFNREGDEDDEEERDGRERLRLAGENWDRPIVVTTAVQFFESLYSNRKKQCRKLHGLARSVVVLDEAQTLPPGMLRPCLAAIRELCEGYGAAAVLCTATQPALTDDRLTFVSQTTFRRKPLPEAIPKAALREIAPEPRRLHEALKRVTVRHAGEMDDAALAEALSGEPQALCIVNNRRHARELFEVIRDVEGAAHLTTAMVPAHRRAKLAAHREALEKDRPLRLIATSLIEAGVDIDFPAVFRAEAGIDSIAQAAGRCNREGRMGREAGRVTVFRPPDAEGRKPPAEMKQMVAAAQSVLRDHDDLLSLDAVTAYFEALYASKGPEALDTGSVMALSSDFSHMGADFVDIANAFRMIDNRMVPVIIPAAASAHGAGDDLMRVLEYAEWVNGDTLRRLQQHVVQIPEGDRRRLTTAGAARVIRPADFGEQFVVLTNDDLYDDARGFDWSDPTWRAIESGIL